MSDGPDCSGHGHNLTETGTIRTTESDRTHFGSPESELQPVSNRLANETSPYLLQHKDNPVDWYPWGEEAFAKARETGKPLLVSIGYSSCHWCHVMAHESFEDDATAALMNDWFVNIKVDREERPDIDAIYMAAVQAMTRQGGWPLNVFITPDGDPFYGGTYWPPADRQGMPSFKRVLEAIHDTYVNKQDELIANSGQIRDHLALINHSLPVAGEIDDELTEKAVQVIARHFDLEHGGFGSAPKFPQASAVEFFLRRAKRGDHRAQAMLETTLDKMAAGGIYDQIGGGFHRYAVDAIWLVPHFEKMLYDNAQLARLYLDGFRLTEKTRYRRVATETLDYVLREMTSEQGGFYATQDADSEGIEGKFYVWSPSEVIAILGQDDGEQFNRWFDITPSGNFEGHNIPHQVIDDETIAEELGVTTREADALLAGWKSKLYAERSKRVWPGRDDKIILAWNGMMLRAFAEAARALNRADYLAAAEKNANFLLNGLKLPEGQLAHVLTAGKPGVPAFLDDLANFAEGLVALYEASFDAGWLDAALTIVDQIINDFSDDEQIGFYDTSTSHERLIARPRDIQDGATPSGNAVTTTLLLRIAAMTESEDLQARALRILETMSRPMAEQPLGFGRMLCAADLFLGPIREIAIAGSKDQAGVMGLAHVVARRYEPNAVMGLADPGQQSLIDRLPFLQFRPMRGGIATAYLCERHTCLPPVTTEEDLNRLLDEGTGVMWVSF